MTSPRIQAGALETPAGPENTLKVGFSIGTARWSLACKQKEVGVGVKQLELLKMMLGERGEILN